MSVVRGYEIWADAVRRERTAYLLVKRSLDITLALIALVLLAPLLIAAIIAIRLDSPGPALYKQRRMGQGGSEFELVKLRGMFVDARERFPSLYDYAAMIPHPELRFHQHHDPRVTRVGRLLRKASLDEVPNLWNVIKGDMSLVGPRPEIPELANLYGPQLDVVLSVKPGVTSPAKARGRDALTFEQTLAQDLDYVENRSLMLDLRTLARTVVSVAAGQNVH